MNEALLALVEKQKIAIIRMMLMNPSIMLLGRANFALIKKC